MALSRYHAIMVRTQIQVTREDLEELKKLSIRDGCSISEVIRRGIRKELNVNRASRKWEDSLKAVGQFRSGLSDLATNHDAYLPDEW